MDFETFLAQVSQRSIPQSPMARARLLARELAEGAANGFWSFGFRVAGFSAPLEGEYAEYWEGKPELEDPKRLFVPNEEVLLRYLKAGWNAPNLSDFPEFPLMVANGFLTVTSSRLFWDYTIVKPAFDLLEDRPPANIFISYRRRESSAFALLVLARLKEYGLNAFLDMSIQPGDNWREHLRDQIQAREYFVVLLSKDSLNSDVVRQELTWAIEHKANIIPIWHNGFTYQSGDITGVTVETDRLLTSTHTIRVLEESALAYNNALVELLNRFGITP
jgi:hypothetical protein